MKKITTLFLVLCLLLSIMPTAFAEEATENIYNYNTSEVGKWKPNISF